MIAAYKHNQNYFFMDPTNKFTAFGNLSNNLINKQGLLLNPHDPKFLTVSENNDLPFARIEIQAKLDSLTECEAEITMLNDYFSNSCYYLEKSTKLELENFLSNTLNSQMRKISFDYFSLISQDNNKIKFKAKCNLNNFMIESARKYYFPKLPFIFGSNELLERDDNLPIYFDNLMRTEMEIFIDIDKKIPPQKLKIGNKKNLFICANMENSQNQIKLFYNINQKKKIFKNNQDCHNIIKKYYSNKNAMFIIPKEKI